MYVYKIVFDYLYLKSMHFSKFFLFNFLYVQGFLLQTVIYMSNTIRIIEYFLSLSLSLSFCLPISLSLSLSPSFCTSLHHLLTYWIIEGDIGNYPNGEHLATWILLLCSYLFLFWIFHSITYYMGWYLISISFNHSPTKLTGILIVACVENYLSS